MRKILKYNFLAVIFLSLTTGCSDYLSELPDGRTQIDSPEKVTQLITGAYPLGGYMMMADLMGDSFEDKGVISATKDLEIDLFQWKDVNLPDRDGPNFYWNSCYKAISQANQALDAIESLGGGEDMNGQKGEALVARAYAHFMLVNFWGKHYNPTSSETDLGIPYVTEPETVLIKKYKRNTVKEVYDFVEKDLLEGIELLSDQESKSIFHFTKKSAFAFAARYYLYKAEWQKVIDYASEALPGNLNNALRDYNLYRGMSYNEQNLRHAGTAEGANLLVVSTSSTYRRFLNSRFGLSYEKVDKLFFRGSKNPFLKAWAYSVFGAAGSYNLPKLKEYFKVTNASAGTGQPFIGMVLFSNDELLLNKMEANVMLGNYNTVNTDLDIYIPKKTLASSYNELTEEQKKISWWFQSFPDAMSSLYSVTKNELTPFYTIEPGKQSSYIKMLLELRQREFCFDGLRWFDLRRHNIVVKHKMKNGSTLVLKKQDLRKQLQIPEAAIISGLEQNPR